MTGKRAAAVPFIVFYIVTAFIIISYYFHDHHSISERENRELAFFPGFTPSSFVKGEYQNTLEEALKDQLFGRDPVIKLMESFKGTTGQIVNSLFNSKAPAPVEPTEPGPGAEDTTQPAKPEPVQERLSLTPVRKIYNITGTGYLTYYPHLSSSGAKTSYLAKINQINNLADMFPDVKVYVYYVRKTEDVSWFDESERITAFDYGGFIEDNLSDKVRFGSLTFHDFEEMKRLLYKTDHHWSHEGSYKGYSEILAMMRVDYPDLPPVRVPLYLDDFGTDIQWYGSKANDNGVRLETDEFKVYRYEFEDWPYEAYYGNQKRDIGRWPDYDRGVISKDLGFYHYQQYFGMEYDVIKYIFPDNYYNLLVIGDSQYRPIRKVLGSHFYTSIYYYRENITKNVNVQKVITENNIDAVLFIGQHDYWRQYFLDGIPRTYNP